MMMLSVEQIRAARAWIGWSRGNLAERAGVSEATVRNVEKGKVSARSAESIRMAFEGMGFKFYGKNGITRNSDENRTYDGPNSCNDFYDELLTTIKQHGGEIAITFRTQTELLRSLGITESAGLERLEAIVKFAPVKCLLLNERAVSIAPPS